MEVSKTVKPSFISCLGYCVLFVVSISVTICTERLYSLKSLLKKLFLLIAYTASNVTSMYTGARFDRVSGTFNVLKKRSVRPTTIPMIGIITKKIIGAFLPIGRDGAHYSIIVNIDPSLNC